MPSLLKYECLVTCVFRENEARASVIKISLIFINQFKFAVCWIQVSALDLILFLNFSVWDFVIFCRSHYIISLNFYNI